MLRIGKLQFDVFAIPNHSHQRLLGHRVVLMLAIYKNVLLTNVLMLLFCQTSNSVLYVSSGCIYQ